MSSNDARSDTAGNAELRSDALVMEARLLRWRDEAKSDFGRDMADDAARIVRKLREALA